MKPSVAPAEQYVYRKDKSLPLQAEESAMCLTCRVVMTLRTRKAYNYSKTRNYLYTNTIARLQTSPAGKETIVFQNCLASKGVCGIVIH